MLRRLHTYSEKMKYVCVAISPPHLQPPLASRIALALVLYCEVKLFKVKSSAGVAIEQWHLGRAGTQPQPQSQYSHNNTLRRRQRGPETTSMSMAIEHNNNTNTYAHTRATSAVRSLAGNSDASSFSCWLRRLVSILPIPIPIPTPYSRLLTPGLPVSPSTSYQRASTVCRLPSAAIPARPTVGQWAGVQRLEVKL